jgi:hypothetical protein
MRVKLSADSFGFLEAALPFGGNTLFSPIVIWKDLFIVEEYEIDC